MNQTENPLVDPPNFLLAMKDAGYVNAASALSELVDNSIDANASRIQIGIRSDTQNDPAFTVVDDGQGMDAATLARCLLFGGSSRFDDRLGLGRFGMGLPTASLSQADAVVVTSWRFGSEAGSVALRTPRSSSELPPTSRHMPQTPSGTVIEWYGCHAITPRSVLGLARLVRRELGQTFRRFISRGLEITVNGMRVEPVDPTLQSVTAMGVRAESPFEQLEYRFPTASGESTVRVRFFELPVREWFCLETAEKRTLGITGRAGCSVLRGDREIAYGWHFFGKKRKENYDDWWRCEVEFDPSLDEAFGITNTKQGVRPSEPLRLALEPEMESLARILNRRARESFEAAKVENRARLANSIARHADPLLPPLPGAAGGPLHYRLGVEERPGQPFIDSQVVDGTLHTVLNSDHPMFRQVMLPLGNQDDRLLESVRVGLELAFLALGRAMVQRQGEEAGTESLVECWSDNLTKFMRST